MECTIEQITEFYKIFENEATCCAAVTVAVIAFLLGVIVTCLLCKICRKPCGAKACTHAQKSSARRANEKKGEEKPFEKRKPHPAPADGSIEIYVGNLSYDMTEDQLRETFAAFGTINNVRLVMNRATGKSKGFGFVQMPNRDEVDKACEALNDKEVMGRKIKCNVAKNTI